MCAKLATFPRKTEESYSSVSNLSWFGVPVFRDGGDLNADQYRLFRVSDISELFLFLSPDAFPGLFISLFSVLLGVLFHFRFCLASVVSVCLQSDGTEVTAEALDGKVLAVYFSASWCAPCKQFTPILKSVYNQLQKDGEKQKQNKETRSTIVLGARFYPREGVLG